MVLYRSSTWSIDLHRNKVWFAQEQHCLGVQLCMQFELRTRVAEP